jgi:hypothetical protein
MDALPKFRKSTAQMFIIRLFLQDIEKGIDQLGVEKGG